MTPHSPQRSRRSFLRLPPPPPRPEERPRLVALVDADACMVPVGGDCRMCVDACPRGSRGIVFGPTGPEVQDECDGCGKCVEACRTVNLEGAIRLVHRSRNVETF